MMRAPRAGSRTLSTTVAVAALLAACSDDDASEASSSAGQTSSATSASTGAAGSGSGGAAATSTTGSGGSAGEGGAAVGGGGSGGATGTFPAQWPDGTNCASEDDVEVWAFDEDTFILRQSLCTHFEAPFFYLLFGQDKAFLQDTGTGDANVQAAVAGVVSEWLATHGKASIELVVTHSHGHGDHIGGDAQFQGEPATTVVGPSASAVQQFFGITSWPTQIVEYDLGGRVLDIVPIPGHQAAHIAVYDRALDLLLTGDTLYPGRLYIDDWQQYRESIPRLVSFVNAGNPVTWVLGTHVEMTSTPQQDFDFAAPSHPNEHPLQLGLEVLLELDAAVQAMGDSPSYEPHDDFIVYPL